VKFWNDPLNKPLIEAIARRYSSGGGYAQACAGKADLKRVAKDVIGSKPSQQYSESKANYRKRVTHAGMRRLNDAGQGADRGSRYVLCNFQNENTVELRGFRGTLRLDTMIACLEFAVMTWHFAKDCEPHLLTTHQFVQYINSPRWRHETKYLRAYLKAKGYDTWVSARMKVPSNIVEEELDESNAVV
jgi:hypothetical protein